MHELDRTAPRPPDWRVELIGVPAGADVQLRLRLESVMEGVLVTGDIDVPVDGLLRPLPRADRGHPHLAVQELYAYAGSTTEATSEEDEVRRIEGDYLDLEPLARDTVVLNLPLAPVCTEDCAGLCVDCGQRLDDLPADHAHEVVDARWAGLAAEIRHSPRRAPPTRAPPLRRTDRGCPEAEDVPRQHPFAPLDVEGHGADPVAVPQPRVR